MKRTLLLLSAFSFAISNGNAQITLHSTDVASPTTTLHLATDTLPTIVAGPGGASQTWNFISLANDKLDTVTILPTSAFPNANFPNANIIIAQGAHTALIYANNSAGAIGSLKIYGYVGYGVIAGHLDTITEIISPSEKILNYPETYSTSFATNYHLRYKYYYGDSINHVFVDSLRSNSNTIGRDSVDAWGTLTTSLGTYDVIRSKEIKRTTDTSAAFFILSPAITPAWHTTSIRTDTSFIYNWYANNLGYTLVSATMNSTGTSVKKVQWLLEASTVGIADYMQSINEKVYPNPASNEINFLSDASKQKEIQVYDIAGRLLDAITINNNLTTFNTSAYANGIYTYNIIGKDNSVLTRGKFIITK
jgi:hypothetical protein